MDKRDQKTFIQSPCRQYIAMPGKLLRRANTQASVSSLWEDHFRTIEQEKKGCALAESESPYSNQERGPAFCVIKFCVSPDYIPAGATGQHVTRWKQVLFFLRQVTKMGGWTTFLCKTQEWPKWPNFEWGPSIGTPKGLLKILTTWNCKGTKTHVPNRILCKKTADLNRRPVWGKGVCSNLNPTAQRPHMAECKCQEIMSAIVWHDSESITIKVCNQVEVGSMKCNVGRPCSLW